MLRQLCKWICTAAILVAITSPSAVLAKRESHDLTLYQGKGVMDPYVHEYEITLEREGLIRVRLEVATMDRKIKKPLVFGISNKQKRKIRTIAHYRSKIGGQSNQPCG